jgi:predicted ferric reductase
MAPYFLSNNLSRQEQLQQQEENHHITTNGVFGVSYGSIDKHTMINDKLHEKDTEGNIPSNNGSPPRQSAWALLLNQTAFLAAFVGICMYCILLALDKYFILAYPLLAAASACTLLSVSTSTRTRTRNPSRKFQVIRTAYQRFILYVYCPNRMHTIIQSLSRIFANDTNHNLVFLSVTLIILPCSIYIIKRITHHLIDEEGIIQIDPSTHRHLANDFGKLSVTAMSYFLIPVSRHSIIIKAVGIHPTRALRMHIWAGCIAISGGVVHGLYWVWNWIFLDHLTMDLIFPTRECWKSGYGFSCHLRFVNLLGIFCGVCFILLGLTSMWWVRRNHYRVFYICHVVFSSMLLFGLVMHYNKMIWYLAPGLLYYMASSVPVWIEGIQKWRQGGVMVSNVVHVPDSGGCVELSIRMDGNGHGDIDTHASARICGKYAKLCVPEVSAISHPFTVFSHPNHLDGMKILFRAYGPFTTQLSNKLIKSSPSKNHNPCPKILVDGLYGGSDQLAQALRHDTIVVIAGGVGIVSYISLISLLQSILIASKETDEDLEEKSNLQNSGIGMQRTKHVYVHWSSRDEGLIDHVMQNYFTSSMDCSSGSRTRGQSAPIEFVVHHTRLSQSPSSVSSPTKEPEWEDDTIIQQEGNHFLPAASASSIFGGHKDIVLHNILPTTTLSCIAWGGLWIIQYCYENIQDKRNVQTRNITILAIVVWSIVISITSLIAVKIGSIYSKFAYSKLDGDIPKNTRCPQKGQGLTHSMDFSETDLSSTTCNIDGFSYDDTAHSMNVSLDTESQSRLQSHSLFADGNRYGNGICVSHSRGRPNISNIIQEILDDKRDGSNDNDNGDVGIFMCGPTVLLQSVRNAIDEREDGSLHTTVTKLRAAVYEEVFEL